MKNKGRNIFLIISSFIFVSSLSFLFISRKNEVFASFMNEKLASPLKNGLLFLSNPVPFSLFEFLCFLLPALFFLLIFFIFKRREKIIRAFLSVLSVFLLVFSLLINTLLIGYGVDIGFKVKDFGNDELSLSLSYLKDKVNSYEGASFPELNQLSFKLYSAYSSLSLPETHVSYPCPKVKVIKNKALASKLGILGSYSFLTSEININPAAPTYTLVFSVAHEMAHLFGISGEAEASFYAYLASLETDDDAIAYSAALSALEYLLSEAYAQDRALFEKTYLLLSEKAKCDLREYRDFYSENHAKISVYSEMANGAFLDFADANGSKDYGDFTKLFVSYLTEEVL